MYTAGLSIIRCLEMLETQTENKDFKYIIADIKQSIETGSNLKTSFGKYRSIFSDFFLGMIEAGETAGELPKTLEMSADYMEKQLELRRKIKSAFTYPIIVSILCFVVVICLLVFIIPVFSNLYRQLRVPLPGPTQALIYLSDLVTSSWVTLIIAGGGIVLLLNRLVKTSFFKAKWDIFKLNMPVFAKLNRMIVVSRFTRTFAMLASVGISLIESLEVASLVVRNYKMSKIAKELQAAIEAGNPIAEAMKAHDIFPPIIMQLTASGEETGTLPAMLNKGADFIDKDIDRSINALLVKLEPALTVIMGVIVGFLLLGVYLPMFDYIGHLK